VIDLLTCGETMAALRAEGPIRLGGALRLSVAGAESNVAIGVARLGHTARWVGRVGDDEFGTLVLRTLRAEGVDVSHARRDMDAPTGMIVFEHRIAGITRVEYRRAGSAGSRLTADEVTGALGDGARVLHLTGITAALGPDPAAAMVAAAARQHAAGGVVCLDVNHRARLWSAAEAGRALAPLLPYVSVLIGSPDEIALLVPGIGEPGERIRALIDAGVAEVVVKNGADGAGVHTAGVSLRRPAHQVTAVDTVGAGDAFTAGYLSALLDGEPTAGRLSRALAVAAFAVSSPGDWEGLPDRADLDLLAAEPGSTLR
jgi:2-dehydro-3-deoxygluconokinase